MTTIMKKGILTLTISIFICKIMVFGQTTFADSVEFYFNEQLLTFPHEKIYLQTDKSGYLSGEKIWFRSHMVNALTHKPIFLSRYVYVELISPMEDLVVRVMIRPDSTGVYSGYIDLADDLTEGTYTLRAYTNFMRNSGEESFFRKTVTVLAPFSLHIEPVVNFEVEKNEVKTTLKFVDRQLNDTITPEIVSCKLTHKQEKTLNPGKGKTYKWNVNLPQKAKNRTMLLSLLYKGRKYNRFYTIPYDPAEYEVVFFPEGGYLIPGNICKVGFKALNPGGLGEDISGVLYNSKNEEIQKFKSLHFGMGFFSFAVAESEKYYIICKNANGTIKRTDLPEPELNATVVSTQFAGNRVMTRILGNEATRNKTHSLLVHHKGEIIYHELLNPESKAYVFPADSMPKGILSFILLDNRQNILSERLIFNFNENDFPSVSDSLYKPAYQRRELIEQKIKISDNKSNPLSGNFAVSVTDKNTVIQDTALSILSSLLIDSELKGYIEAPASYFTGNKVLKYPLDALMLTQGWRRYDIPAVLKGNIEIPEKFEPELSQRIRGKSDAMFGSLKEGEISLMATLDSMVSTVVTQADNKGNFSFDVEYPAGTSILVQSLSRKGGKHNFINLELQEFPETAGSGIPVKTPKTVQHNKELDDYLIKADQEYTTEHGIRSIIMEEITVVAESLEKYKESVYYSPLSASGLKTSEDIEKMVVSSLRALLYTQPGVIVKTDKVTSTRSDKPIMFIIDNMMFEDFFDRLDDIEVSSIESLFVIRDNSMMPGYFPNTDGAIVITTKIGYTPKPKKRPNIDEITPQGYQQAAEFYTPVYETPEQAESGVPDLRTTIYWKPNLIFSENGEAVVSFYSADTPTTYQMIIEGVSNDGTPVNYSNDIIIKKQ